MNVAQQPKLEYPSAEKLEMITRECLTYPQLSGRVVHRFGPGLYIRELTVPVTPGTASFMIGRCHKVEHVNIMLKGRVVVLKEDGSLQELVAPLTFIGKPGQKIGLVLEEMVWLNVWATDETDVEKLEATFLEPSDPLEEAKKMRLITESASRIKDREDFHLAISELGFTAEQVREISEDESNLIDMPMGIDVGFVVSKSSIEGRGVFASNDFTSGDIIGPSRLNIGTLKRTPLGRWINHSKNPNAVVVDREGGRLDIMALMPINGSHGGQLGDEITIDYRRAFKTALIFLKG